MGTFLPQTVMFEIRVGEGGGGGGGAWILCPRGDSHVKGVGMLVFSLRGLNHGFWYYFQGCPGQNTTIFSHQGIV